MKKILGVVLLALAGYYVWHVHINFRFEQMSSEGVETKVFKSALIAPDKLEGFLKENKIKTVIDLLDPTVKDKLNPALQSDIDNEDTAIKAYNEKYKLAVQHINIQSRQVPTKKTLTKFYEVMDNKANYPVLIHCYHGTGRAQIYSALYRIEYEKWDTEKARQDTRFMVEGLGYRSSFAKGRGKGDFLINYVPRDEPNATLKHLEK